MKAILILVFLAASAYALPVGKKASEADAFLDQLFGPLGSAFEAPVIADTGSDESDEAFGFFIPLPTISFDPFGSFFGPSAFGRMPSPRFPDFFRDVVISPKDMELDPSKVTSTSETKMINGHKVEINETKYEDNDNHQVIKFHVVSFVSDGNDKEILPKAAKPEAEKPKTEAEEPKPETAEKEEVTTETQTPAPEEESPKPAKLAPKHMDKDIDNDVREKIEPHGETDNDLLA